MREIKFRAWQKNHKKMCFVPQIEWDKGEIIRIKFYNGNNCAPRFSIYGLKDWPLDCIELMQYTGLKDKNGVEIYEGDILSLESDKTVLDVVEFGYHKLDDDSWGVSYCTTGFYIKYPDGGVNPIHDLEYTYGCRTSEHIVIGNIHENPELL